VKTEKGVIIVAYKESRRNNRYAVLQRKKNWEGWELPKGHLEEDDYRETVMIELDEEAGIEEEEIEKITDIEETVFWEYKEDGEKVKREYKSFIVKVKQDTLVDTSSNPHDEHVQGFFLGLEDTKELLTYENNQEILEKADKSINSED
jgi:NUDIX domain.